MKFLLPFSLRFPLPFLAHMLLKYKKIREHADLLLTSRMKELKEKNEELKTENGSEINETRDEVVAERRQCRSL